MNARKSPGLLEETSLRHPNQFLCFARNPNVAGAVCSHLVVAREGSAARQQIDNLRIRYDLCVLDQSQEVTQVRSRRDRGNYLDRNFVDSDFALV